MPGASQGYFAGDTRLVSELRLRVSGHRPRVIDVDVDGRLISSMATVGDPSRPDLLISRRTRLGKRLRLEVGVENLTNDAISSSVDLFLVADFADLFEVKRGVTPRTGFIGSGPIDGALVLTYVSGDFRRSLIVTCDRACEIFRDGLSVGLELAPRARLTATFDLQPTAAPDTPLAPSGFDPVDTCVWDDTAPRFHTSSVAMQAAWDRSEADLASLLLAEPGKPDRPIVAAGSPWFMALFGRDSLLTSWSALPLGAALGLGTLSALANRQGRAHVPESAEQPGRILHELRSGEVVLRPDGWGAVYYGSVDATPLFVMTLAEVWRWGAPTDEIAALLPAAERAVEWIIRDGDADGDGLVEYGNRAVAGVAALANQGWKDSHDSIRQPDGSLAVGPIALVEVQGYCHGAFLALADLREAFGTGDPSPLRRLADELAAAIDSKFWMDDEDCYALALDGDKRQVRTVSSNAGHLLWTGTAGASRAASLSSRLMADDMFTGFGLRTLSSINPGYNPLSYHCGSVWPHDTAIVAAGMMRAGCHEAGSRLAMALFDATAAFDARPPELFGGFSSADCRRPAPYPTSCSPQAWAAGASPLLVRAMLGLQPHVPNGVIRLDPHLPPGVRLTLDGLPLGSHRLDLRAADDTLEMVHVSSGLRVEGPPGVGRT